MNELFMYIVKKFFLIKITLQVTINRKFGLEDVIYIYTIEYYSVIKKSGVLPLSAT